MTTLLEHRGDARFKCQSKVTFENYYSGNYYQAIMYNYSRSGMYFESDYAPLPGTEIYIGIENSPYDIGPDFYRAQIRWRRELSKDLSNHQFGVGVKYQYPINP